MRSEKSASQSTRTRTLDPKALKLSLFRWTLTVLPLFPSKQIESRHIQIFSRPAICTLYSLQFIYIRKPLNPEAILPAVTFNAENLVYMGRVQPTCWKLIHLLVERGGFSYF